MSDQIPPLLEFAPHLKRKRESECKHAHCEVDRDAASLTCADCDAELDPWWFLRSMAEREEEQREEDEAKHARAVAWTEQANRTIARLNAEIAALTEAKNRLWNEQVNGRPLGAQVRRSRT